MASVTTTREDLFPNGTTVSAYATTVDTPHPAAGAPSGPVAASGVVSGGSLTLTGLDGDRSYWLHAPSPDRYMRIFAPAPQSSSSSSGGGGDVGQNVFDGGWGPRPDSPVVLWVGGSAATDDPTDLMEDGDIWFPGSA